MNHIEHLTPETLVNALKCWRRGDLAPAIWHHLVALKGIDATQPYTTDAIAYDYVASVAVEMLQQHRNASTAVTLSAKYIE